MELSESPLDVLSRAATMVQDGLPLTSDDTNVSSTKQLPTTKWKRERRTSRLPEYSRKSDPKLPENLPPEICSSPSTNSSSSESGSGSPTYVSSKFKPLKDAPLDMSVKPRGSPPSYSQAISNRSGYRPSVITTTTPPNGNVSPKPESKSISMCDPIIDEHFRRSLGKDYAILFASKEKVKKVKDEKNVIENFREMMDTDAASLSVDDHFAKALGDTWLQLNGNKKENKNTRSRSPGENGNKIRVTF